MSDATTGAVHRKEDEEKKKPASPYEATASDGSETTMKADTSGAEQLSAQAAEPQPQPTSSTAGAPRMLIRPFPIDEYNKIKERGKKKARSGKQAKAKRGEKPPPRGHIGMLAEVARCTQRDCLRPILVTGTYAWSFNSGPRSGQIVCVACVGDLHRIVKARWDAQRKRMIAKYGEEQVNRITVGRVSNRDHRRRSRSRMG